MSKLANKNCKPHNETTILATEQIPILLKQVGDWKITNTQLQRKFKFKDYHQTMAFVNAVVWIAHQQDHHPEMLVNYNHCSIRYSSHSVGGLSENDFICAAKIDGLLE